MIETTTLPVIGMTCGGCVNSVTRALQAMPGVTSVSVSLDRAEASVQHDPAAASVQRLRQAITDAGFEAG